MKSFVTLALVFLSAPLFAQTFYCVDGKNEVQNLTAPVIGTKTIKPFKIYESHVTENGKPFIVVRNGQLDMTTNAFTWKYYTNFGGKFIFNPNTVELQADPSYLSLMMNRLLWNLFETDEAYTRYEGDDIVKTEIRRQCTTSASDKEVLRNLLYKKVKIVL